MICHYWFFNHWFKFQDSVCNGCHDLTILYLNVSNNAIITVKNNDYHCIIHDISKFKAINLLKILFLKIVDICKNIALILSLLIAVFFFLLFWFNMYNMVDSEYSTDNQKSSKISIGTVMNTIQKC